MSSTVRRPPSLRELRARRDEILSLARRYGASNVRVFGSVAREETEARDVDFLIDLGAGRSLLDLAGLHVELEGRLKLTSAHTGHGAWLQPRPSWVGRKQGEAEATP